MIFAHPPPKFFVNCRIGSLESQVELYTPEAGVNCRIGSLENMIYATMRIMIVNCRIGSLEMAHRRHAP